MKYQDRKNSTWGVVFLVGIVTGWFINMIIPKETKQKASRTIKDLLTDPKKQAELRGKVIDNYQEAKDKLIGQLQSLKLSIDQIDKQKYMEVVDEVISEMKQDKEMASKQLNKLRSYLESDFDLLKTNKDIHHNEPPTSSRIE